MKRYVTILFLLKIAVCNAQNTQTEEDIFNVNHGVSINRIDSSLQKQIRVVHFDSSEGVIFPTEYGNQTFGKNVWWAKRTFFTPDTFLIKKLDTALRHQYCAASRRFDEAVWQSTLDRLKEEKDKKELKIYKQQLAVQRKRFEKFCPKWQQDLICLDKQYLGFITENGERIIYIQLLDFRQDPYNLKHLFKISWIEGWHGWFETNTRRLHYHVDKNLLTINEGL